MIAAAASRSNHAAPSVLSKCTRRLRRSRSRADQGHATQFSLDDARFRAFDTMGDYRRWCEATGSAMPALEYRQAEEIRDAFAGPFNLDGLRAGRD